MPGRTTRTADTNGKPPSQGFKGNKSTLPSKPCLACGREMTWRKAWAKNWAEVRYCSDACRQNKNAKNALKPKPAPKP